MARCFLLLMSALLLLGLPTQAVPAGLAEVAAEALDDDCHCCDDGDAEEGDCCDVDFGACCATGMVAALHVPRAAVTEPSSAVLATHHVVPVHLLRPRDNGPPPTPPPIG